MGNAFTRAYLGHDSDAGEHFDVDELFQDRVHGFEASSE